MPLGRRRRPVLILVRLAAQRETGKQQCSATRTTQLATRSDERISGISQSRAITRPIEGSSNAAWGVLPGQSSAACRMTRREVSIAVAGDPVILGDR